MKDANDIQTWYRNFAASHSPEQREHWYSDVADAYNQVRPRYPQALIDRVVEVAKLPSDARILELGCGPGNATTAFAALGYAMVCLEPSPEACHLARQNCAPYTKVDIQTTRFETWQLPAEPFHAVLAANAWHWIPPDIAAPKAAMALCPHGTLILLWNMTQQVPYAIHQALDAAVYQPLAPTLSRWEDYAQQAEILRSFGQTVTNSGQFTHLISEQWPCEVSYSIDEYLMLLNTFSHYRTLESSTRSRVFAELRQVLETTCGAEVPLSYLSAFHIAQKMNP